MSGALKFEAAGAAPAAPQDVRIFVCLGDEEAHACRVCGKSLDFPTLYVTGEAWYRGLNQPYYPCSGRESRKSG